MGFRKDFMWGCATAAYQVEGAVAEGGRAPSTWDMMCQKEGAIWSQQSGATACDHYHRYREDVGLMRELGVKGYRFSIAWPRILPEGTGTVNEQGLDFYSRLVDELLAAGIKPYATLFHWDLPYALYLRGGWLNRDIAGWMAEYAGVVARRLGDRIGHWMTHNEPQCTIALGHVIGEHAPGDKLAPREWITASHHLLLSHGRSVQALRANSPRPCQIGYAPVGHTGFPATDQPEDVEAARAWTFATRDLKHMAFSAAWYVDPVLLGHYPEAGLRLAEPFHPPILPGDEKIIHQPLDFLGLNIYVGTMIRRGADGEPEVVPHPTGIGLSAFHWPVVPQVLRWGPRFYSERYRIPLYITESGMSNCDWVALDGKVHDPQRSDYLHRYLRELRRGVEEGADVRGYFVWTLLDNFEWAQGFKQRFGLIHVDYNTQRRTPKDSYYWYQGTIASNGEQL